jgi:hypothetical protein
MPNVTSKTGYQSLSYHYPASAYAGSPKGFVAYPAVQPIKADDFV